MKKTKKLCALLIALSLILTTGCGNQNADKNEAHDAADMYIEKAQKYVDEKDYAAAIDILQLGLETVDDEELEEMLDEVIELQIAEAAENPNEIQAENDTNTNTNTESIVTSGNETSKEMVGNGNESNVLPDVPNQDQMATDLIACGANYINVNNESHCFSISYVELMRRKTDADFDEAHISVVFETEYYVVNAEMALYYVFYDVGGWVLDYYEFTSYRSDAKKLPITNESFSTQMCNYFDSCTALERYSWTNSAGNYCESISFASEIRYEYWTVLFSGEYTFEFYDNVWHENPAFTLSSVDWTPLIGSWQYRDQRLNMGAGFYSAELLLNIVDITQNSEDELQITYSGYSYLYDTTSDRLCANEEVIEQTKSFEIKTTKEHILGIEVALPTRLNTVIKMPWEYKDYPINVYINHAY